MINDKIFLGYPIEFKDICKLYPPTVNDVVGDEDFSICQSLLMMTQEELEDAYVSENVPTIPTPFQYLLMNFHQDKEIREKILHGFKVLLKEDVTIVPELEVIIVGKSEEELDPDKDLEDPRVIKEENYFDFQNLVREVFGSQKVKKPVEDEDPRIRRYKAKVRASERMLAKKKENKTNFGTLLAAICCMGIGLTPLNIGEISYACVPWIIGMSQQKEEYDIDIRALLAGADKKKVKPKYWIKDLNEEK